MRWHTGNADEQTARAASRYDFAVPMTVELSNGFLRTADTLDAFLVDLSEGGAALILPGDPRLKVKKRYRVHVDDHEGIIEIRNLTPLIDEQVRIGVAFSRLDLELQELVSDSLAGARIETGRIEDVA